MYIFDEDSVNTIVAEQRAEEKEIRQRKNEILAMTNPQKKARLWKKEIMPLAIEGLSEKDLQALNEMIW